MSSTAVAFWECKTAFVCYKQKGQLKALDTLTGCSACQTTRLLVAMHSKHKRISVMFSQLTETKECARAFYCSLPMMEGVMQRTAAWVAVIYEATKEYSMEYCTAASKELRLLPSCTYFLECMGLPAPCLL